MRTPLQKSEEILLVTKKSWITLIGPALVALMGLVAGYFIDMGGWGLVVWIPSVCYFLYCLWKWNVDIWVVTNCRVIDESGLINHYAKESPLDKINNVSYDQHFIGRIFNYGHVEIQTAAEIGATDYHHVHNPRKLKDTITSSQSDYKQSQFNHQAIQMANAIGIQQGKGGQSHYLAAELEKLYDLKQKGILSEDEYQRAKNKLLNN
ncbi:MAG TPA: PH domain-containing protein [Flavitalea sp.]|nr:PH domain-containing protein [Flavitalea sp.]